MAPHRRFSPIASWFAPPAGEVLAYFAALLMIFLLSSYMASWAAVKHGDEGVGVAVGLLFGLPWFFLASWNVIVRLGLKRDRHPYGWKISFVFILAWLVVFFCFRSATFVLWSGQLTEATSWTSFDFLFGLVIGSLMGLALHVRDKANHPRAGSR